MIGTLSFFVISLIGMITMVTYKKTHKDSYWFVKKCDDMIMEFIKRVNLWVKFINKKTIGLFIHLVLEKIEDTVNSMLRSLKKRVKK